MCVHNTVETSKGFWMKLSDSFSTSQAKRSCQACPWNWSLTTIRLITLVPPTLYWMDGVMNPWNYYAACFFSFMTHDWSWSDEDDEERYGSFVKTLVADNNDVMSVGKFSLRLTVLNLNLLSASEPTNHKDYNGALLWGVIWVLQDECQGRDKIGRETPFFADIPHHHHFSSDEALLGYDFNHIQSETIRHDDA